MGEGDSRLRRWFGKEHNPRRAALVRQAVRYQLAGDGVVALGAWLWIEVGVIPGILIMGLALGLLGMSIDRIVRARREPHWSAPYGLSSNRRGVNLM